MTMGVSTDAKLVYGYDLGSEGDGLNVAEAQTSEANPYGYLKTAWHDGGAEELDEDTDLIETMTRVLYDAIPDAPPVEYSGQRDTPVKEYYGVWFESHCSDEYPMWMLVAYEVTANRGHLQTLDLDVLTAKPTALGWDEKLASALAVLGVTPTQERPGWLLASNRG
jgi:hypothetical protein